MLTVMVCYGHVLCVHTYKLSRVQAQAWEQFSFFRFLLQHVKFYSLSCLVMRLCFTVMSCSLLLLYGLCLLWQHRQVLLICFFISPLPHSPRVL